jgi:hypothetical protein
MAKFDERQRVYESYTATLNTLARIYELAADVIERRNRSAGAKRGWATRRMREMVETSLRKEIADAE